MEETKKQIKNTSTNTSPSQTDGLDEEPTTVGYLAKQAWIYLTSSVSQAIEQTPSTTVGR